MLPVKAHRDPAPSRLSYRLERLWLRPAIRNAVRLGLPLGIAAACAISLALDPEVRAMGQESVAQLREMIADHPALSVTRMDVSAVSPALKARLEPVLQIDLPVSSMDLDLAALHDEITGLEPVAHAQVRVDADGVLKIDVTERTAAAVWRHDGGLELLDAEGHRLGAIGARADRAALPLVAGHGADRAVAEALALLDLAAPLGERVRGLTRVGERRWTLFLTNDIQIHLPAIEPGPALARVIQLDEIDEVLSRNILHVDMRDPDRPVLRMKPEAVDALRRARNPEVEEDV